jgi:hypothetical protein
MAGALSAVVDEINSRNLQVSDLRLSLFAMLCAPDFDSLQAVRGLKQWNRRVGVLDRVSHATQCFLSTEHLPLDGRTIRPEHFTTVWGVFGFSGPPLPGPRHVLALRDVADSRNAVAHGSEEPQAVAGQMSVSDTIQLLTRVEEVILHLYYAAVDYLDNSRYMR